MARSPNVDLEGMTDAQLRELMEHARGVIGDRFSSRLDEWRTLAHEAGYELTVTKMGAGETRRRRRRSGDTDTGDDKRREVAPKYRNPDNHSQTWTSRGREPKWFTDQLSKGRTRDDMLISQPETSAPTP
jgi:DNA-binding protein H-NS